MTSYKDARLKIRQFNRYELIEALLQSYLKELPKMRIMGLDLGTRTIGVAVSDEMGLIARGIETIRRSGTKNDLARLHELVQKEEVGAFVLGYPKI